MAREKKSLGEKLRRLRETFNLTQGQVAEALNLDRSTYTNYELDKTCPSLETLVKLAHIYNVPVIRLLPEDDGESVTLNDAGRPDSLLRSLSKEERGIIAYYRSMSRENKAKLRAEMAKMIKESPDSDS